MAEHGKFYWNELMTHDVAKAKKFYETTIGWTFEAMPMGPDMTYWIAKMGDQTVGGVFEMNGPEFKGMPEAWMSYVSVDDVDARVANAVKAGAKVCKPAFDVPGVGRIVILAEPGGAMIGWITPAN